MKWNKEKIIFAVHNLEKELKRRPVKKDGSNLYFLSRKYFGSWSNMMNNAGYDTKILQKPKIPSLNSNLLYYFLGLVCTDGHIVFNKQRGNYKIMISNSQNEEKEMIIEAIWDLFKYKASVRSRMLGFNKKPNYEIYVSSKVLCNFFIKQLDVPFGAKSLNIKIPAIMFKVDKRFVWNFIRGVIDGDGSIIKTKKSTMLKIFSGSKDFILGMDKLLRKQGFNSGKISNERKNLWLLRITRKEDIRNMCFLIYNSCGRYCYQKKRNIWEQYI